MLDAEGGAPAEAPPLEWPATAALSAPSASPPDGVVQSAANAEGQWDAMQAPPPELPLPSAPSAPPPDDVAQSAAYAEGQWDAMLQVEILSAEQLQPPEYRFGDITWALLGRLLPCSCVGSQPGLRPKVELQWAEQVAVSAHRDSDMAERALLFDVRSFHQTLRLPLPQLLTGRDFELHVRDHQPSIFRDASRGDPLIGSAVLELEVDDLGVRRERKIDILRHGEVMGTLTVVVSVVAGEHARRILARPKDHPVNVFGVAFMHAMSQQDGVELMWRARPDSVTVELTDEIRGLIRRWIKTLRNFCTDTQGHVEENARRIWARHLQAAKKIVGALLGMGANDKAVEDTTVEWMRRVIWMAYSPDMSACPPWESSGVSGGGAESQMSGRLKEMLKVAALPDDADPRTAAAQFDARIPPEASDEEATAICRALMEALLDEEEDGISLEPLFNEHRRLARPAVAWLQLCQDLGTRSRAWLFFKDTIEQLQRHSRGLVQNPFTRLPLDGVHNRLVDLSPT